MTTSVKMAAIAALVGEAGRARMLIALMDGRALTATELAQLAGISAPTASGHLGKLTQAGLLAVLPQGRHRYFRLASPAVARLLEGIMVVAAEPASEQRPEPRISSLLREARTCYDHLAGRLGVALTDALIHKGAIELGDEAGRVTEFGESFLQTFGISRDQAAVAATVLPSLSRLERAPFSSRWRARECASRSNAGIGLDRSSA